MVGKTYKIWESTRLKSFIWIVTPSYTTLHRYTVCSQSIQNCGNRPCAFIRHKELDLLPGIFIDFRPPFQAPNPARSLLY